jgi:glycosyltransferase involved in cell wall biosynthesis
VHHHLRKLLDGRPDVRATFLDVPPPGLLRRIVGASVPGLAALDLDLQPLRAQLALSTWVAMRLRRAVQDVDVVHVYTHNAALLAAPLLRRVPMVVTTDTTNARNAYRLPYRTPTRWTPWAVRLTLPLERRVHRLAHTVVANSDWAATSLREDYGLPDTKLRVIPFGVDPPELPAGPAPGTTSPRPTLVFVGRQLERKGALRLLRLHQEHLADRADLVLVTPEPVPPGRSLRVIDDLRPGDDRLWEILRSASVFVFPSEIDQAPNAVLEAMAAGLPVIAARSGAVPEMVTDGICGRIVEPGDDRDLLAAITDLLDDPQRRSSMGAAAQRRQRERYDMRHAVDELLAVLRCAAADRRTQERDP